MRVGSLRAGSLVQVQAKERRGEENGPLDVGSAPKIIFPEFGQVTCHWLSEPARRLAY